MNLPRSLQGLAIHAQCASCVRELLCVHLPAALRVTTLQLHTVQPIDGSHAALAIDKASRRWGWRHYRSLPIPIRSLVFNCHSPYDAAHGHIEEIAKFLPKADWIEARITVPGQNLAGLETAQERVVVLHRTPTGEKLFEEKAVLGPVPGLSRDGISHNGPLRDGLSRDGLSRAGPSRDGKEVFGGALGGIMSARLALVVAVVIALLGWLAVHGKTESMMELDVGMPCR
ncbi:hypothetical protein IAT38_007346 [Cryptococcus sp. DSM 104549]